jgi:hypothetical protein
MLLPLRLLLLPLLQLRHVFKDTKLFYRFAGDEYSETDTDEVRTQRSTMMQQTKRSSFVANGTSKSPRHGAPPNSIPLEVLLRDGEPGPSPKASQTGHSQVLPLCYCQCCCY